ncbi:MAG: TetR/AcrR family transcriptional regulator [Acidimicrobiales bacterium]|nr:TetR/AcrR family transcriptional regulator [Acidimicrobiales bacterium]
MSAPRTARQRARAEITGEILATARAHLAARGPADLSLRAVARDLGMTSSAVYRYFASRDALLTALIVEGYEAMGSAVESAEARVRRRDLAARWRTASTAVRTWALAHPHEYALLYGTPVPGYEAPATTVDPATRVARVLVAILADAAASAPTDPPPQWWPPLVAHLRADVVAGAGAIAPDVPPAWLARGLLAWIGLYGFVSFELFGHLVGSVEDPGLLFEQFLLDSTVALGLR